MGFSSMDDFVNKVTNLNQFYRADWNKNALPTTTQVAGEWYCLFMGSGNPSAGVFASGTNLSFQSLCDQLSGGIQHGGDVFPATKHILNASAFSAGATSMPAVLMLVDLLGYYPMTTVTTVGNQRMFNSAAFTVANSILTSSTYDIAPYSTVQFSNSGGTLPSPLMTDTNYYTLRSGSGATWTNFIYDSLSGAIAGSSPTSFGSGAIIMTTSGTGTNIIQCVLPRYSDGTGVQCFVTPATVMGAATPSISITYTNASGTSLKVTPPILPVGKTAAPVGHIAYSGVAAAGKYGPFMPLSARDTGIRSLQSGSLSVSWASGQLAFVLCKPLLTLPMTTIGVAAERDLMNQLPSLPQIKDGACLAWLIYAGANTPVNTAFYGHLDFGWG